MNRKQMKATADRLTLYNDILTAIEGSVKTGEKPFPHKYICYSKPPKFERTLLKVSDNEVVHETDRGNLLTDIFKWCNIRGGKGSSGKRVTESVGREAARYVFQMLPCLDEPPALFRLYDEKGYCFHRVPYMPDPNMPTPVFDDFLRRQSDDVTCPAFIGSLFFPESDRQQYLWITGDGGEGKSTFTTLVASWLGPGCAAEAPPKTDAAKRFIVSNMVEKRLILFSDIDDLSFVNSGGFRTLTGDDPQKSEFKGKDAKTVFDFTAKFLFTSNYDLSLDYLKANIRRALYVKITAPEARKPDYKRRFWGEGPGILHKCIQAYRDHALPTGEIPIPDSEIIAEMISDQVDTFSSIFDQYFIKCTYDLNSDSADWPKTSSFCIRNFLKSQRLILQKTEQNAFFNWLREVQGIKKIRYGRTKTTMYVGIKFRHAAYGLPSFQHPNYIENL